MILLLLASAVHVELTHLLERHVFDDPAVVPLEHPDTLQAMDGNASTWSPAVVVDALRPTAPHRAFRGYMRARFGGGGVASKYLDGVDEGGNPDRVTWMNVLQGDADVLVRLLGHLDFDRLALRLGGDLRGTGSNLSGSRLDGVAADPAFAEQRVRDGAGLSIGVPISVEARVHPRVVFRANAEGWWNWSWSRQHRLPRLDVHLRQRRQRLRAGHRAVDRHQPDPHLRPRPARPAHRRGAARGVPARARARPGDDPRGPAARAPGPGDDPRGPADALIPRTGGDPPPPAASVAARDGGDVRAGWLVVLLGGGCGTTDGAVDDTDGTDDSDTEDSDVPDDSDADTDVDTDTTVTLGQVQAQVFVGCMGGPGLRTCHGRDPFMGNLDLTQGHAYDSLVGVTASIGGVRVTPGSLEDSVLWRKLTDDLADDASEGDPMPLGEAIQWQSLPQEQIDLVRAWILGGAHE